MGLEVLIFSKLPGVLMQRVPGPLCGEDLNALDDRRCCHLGAC